MRCNSPLPLQASAETPPASLHTPLPLHLIYFELCLVAAASQCMHVALQSRRPVGATSEHKRVMRGKFESANSPKETLNQRIARAYRALKQTTLTVIHHSPAGSESSWPCALPDVVSPLNLSSSSSSSSSSATHSLWLTVPSHRPTETVVCSLLHCDPSTCLMSNGKQCWDNHE